MKYPARNLSLMSAFLLLLTAAPNAHANSGSATLVCIPNDGGDVGPGDTVQYSPTVLWPPDHTLQTITITGHDTADPGEANFHIKVTNITSNQTEDEGKGCGQPNPPQGPDWTGIGNQATGGNPVTSVELRAERCANLGDRVYTITVSCDEEGETGSAKLQVTVPKDLSE